MYREECDSRCGSGHMRQLVRCIKATGKKEEIVDEMHCHGMPNRPDEVISCFGKCHATHWRYTKWSQVRTQREALPSLIVLLLYYLHMNMCLNNKYTIIQIKLI